MTAALRGGLHVVVGLVLVSVLLLTRVARAADPEISVAVDTQLLSVGETLRLTMHVSSKERPGQPQVAPLKGFTLAGSSSGPSQSVTIINGQMTTKQGLDANWTLRAEKVGTWLVGPVTIQIGTNRYRADPIKVVVVAPGQAPHRASNDPFGGMTPFDPFKNLFDALNPSRDPSYGTDPKLALTDARGTVAFLHATVEPTTAVVGQQVTVSMYLYTDANEREANMADVHEATAADFLKRVLFEDDNSNRNLVRATAGGRIWNVRLLRKWALFPLRAGDLVVTPMELTLVRSRVTGEPSRKSELLTVHVTEPPVDRRPPGYSVGDVGAFGLNVDVTPRDIEQDGALGVTLTVSGTGNLPAMITPPAQADVEWLAPEVHEKVGAEDNDRFGGTRTFSYVVRVHRAGNVALGAIGLPYWDPGDKQYHVARAELGTVTVHPNPTHNAEDRPPDPLPNLPPVRARLGGTRAPSLHLIDAHRGWFLFAVCACPLGVAFFSGASSSWKSVRLRLRERSVSPVTELALRLKVGNRAVDQKDARATSAATTRALEMATLAYAGTNVRDARGGEARGRLIEAGVPAETAESIGSMLAECETARFAPEEPPFEEALARWKQAVAAIAVLKATRSS